MAKSQTITNQYCLDAALAYATAGLSVIPITEGSKKPAVAEWKDYQTRRADLATIRQWYGGATKKGVAIVGGAASGNLTIFDFDERANEVFPAWCDLLRNHYGLDVTKLGVAVVETGKGYHVYAQSSAPALGNEALALTPARDEDGKIIYAKSGKAAHKKLIETRGAGGYAVAPPTLHASTGKPYRLATGTLEDLRPLDAEDFDALVAASRFFDESAPNLDTTSTPPATKRVAKDTTSTATLRRAKAYYAPRIADILEEVATAGDGTKHDTLRDAAYTLGGYVPSGLLTEEDARAKLRNAIERNPNNVKDIQHAYKTIDTSLADGATAPLAIELPTTPQAAVSAPTSGANGATAPNPPAPHPSGANGASAPSSEAVVTPKTVSLAALAVTDFPPTEWIVDGLIAKGNFVILGGRPKGGKSWLALQGVSCVDSGGEFLGRATQHVKTLYVALEDGERRVARRIGALGWTPTEDASAWFHVAKFDYPNGALGPGLRQIEQAALSGSELIVIDTLIATLSGGANENDNAQMGAILNELARIAHDYNVAILAVHHTGKGATEDVFAALRGASAIRGAYDVGLILDRRVGEQEAILHAESRDEDVKPITIRQAANGAGWAYVGNQFAIEEVRKGKKTLEALIEMTARAERQGLELWFTVEDVAEERDVAEATAREQMTALASRGYLIKDEGASTSMGRKPDRYAVRQEWREKVE